MSDATRDDATRENTWPTDDDVPVVVDAVETAYRGFLTVDHYRVRVPRFDGSVATIKRELLERGTAVCILPYDPRTDRVLLIRQFLIGAYAAGRAPRPLQVIAGMVDAGEGDEGAARREAMEEAACEIRRVIRAQAFLPTPGGSSERVVAFCEEADLEQAGGVHGAPGEDEDIRVELVRRGGGDRALGRGPHRVGADRHHSLLVRAASRSRPPRMGRRVTLRAGLPCSEGQARRECGTRSAAIACPLNGRIMCP